MKQHEQAPAGFAFFMRLFTIFLAAKISRAIRAVEEPEAAHGPEKTHEKKELAGTTSNREPFGYPSAT